MENVFPFDKKIQYTDHAAFTDQVSKYRLNAYKRNYDLLNKTTNAVDIKNIENLPNGRFSTFINKHEFECLFSQKKSDKLFIQLNGSRLLSDELPIFKRWSYEAILDGSTLNISDPMYRESDTLELGWYYGTKDEAYCNYLVEIITAVADFLHIEKKNIYFYSSSGGGYASIYCCCMIPGSTCITINPQIDLNLYFYNKEFTRITGIDLKEKDPFRRNELLSLMSESTKSRFIIVSNLRAYEDMVQLNALCRHLGCTFTNSLQRLSPNIVSWVYDAEYHPYHSAQDYPEMFFAIRYIADIFDNVEQYENLYRYFAELIHERYNLAEKINEYNKAKSSEINEIFCSEKIPAAESDEYDLCTENIVLKSDRNFYNVTLFSEFEDNSIYNIVIPSACSDDKSCDRYCLMIKNEQTGDIVLKKFIRTGSPVSLYIRTNQSADKYSLKLYPQIPDRNKSTNLTVDKFLIRRIEKPFDIVSDSINLGDSDHNDADSTKETFAEADYLYIRGFAILPNDGRKADINPGWKTAEIGSKNEFIVYYDEKNKVCKTEKDPGNTWVFLLGSFMDTEKGITDINVIGENLKTRLNESLDKFYDYVDILNGRHIIVFSKDGETRLITDATAMRSTYYCETSFCVASHYNLVNDICHCEPHPFFEDYKEYFHHHTSCVSLPGNITPYLGIKLLIPNHSLSLNDGHSIKRFFPRKDIEETDVREVFDYIADNICRQYTNLAKEHDVLHSLTAGCDSRISLAAAKNVKDRITLFTYHNSNPDMNDREQADREMNYRLSRNIAERENLRHIEVFFRGPYPDDLVSIMRKNHYHPHNKLIVEMKKRYKFTPDTIHLRSSIIELLRNTTHILWPVSTSKSAAATMAEWAQYKGEIKEKALPYFEDFIKECDIDGYMEHGYDSLDIIHYWENRLPTWLNASVLTDNDILCDTYMLFNTRKIIAYSFSLPTYWRNKNILFKEIISRLWPSLLDYNMPNSEKPTYDLVDDEFSGCVPMKKVSIKSGNFSDRTRNVDVYKQVRDYGLCAGFISTAVKKDDYISIETEYCVTKGVSYYYEFDVFTAWQNYAEYGEIKYQILIDGNVCYSAFCNDFNNRVNQIMICFKAAESTAQKIQLRIFAVKDTKNNHYNGAVDVKSIILKQEYVKTFSETPKIISSRDIYLGL